MSEENSSNGKTEDSTQPPTFSQNDQTVTLQFNAAHNIIFGGYSHERFALPVLNRVEALERYLDHVIDSYCRLPLQGIRSSDELVSIELEKIYITLCTIAKKSRTEEDQWLDKEAQMLPGEALRKELHFHELSPKSMERSAVKVQQALCEYRRLVVVGDPGCGKTTLLSYLALTYARNWVASPGIVKERLGLAHPRLPILLPLRDFATHLQHAHPDKSLDGSILLLDYLHKFFVNQDIRLPAAFFTGPLKKGTCVVLLDGMDEVAQPETRYGSIPGGMRGIQHAATTII
jgi:predicted NACHT family NTPase